MTDQTEPQSRMRPKEKDDTIAKKVAIGCMISFLHNADNRSAPPALVSRHNTQPLLAVAASNDEACMQ